VDKSSPQILATFVFFKKLSEENYRPICENSPNLVENYRPICENSPNLVENFRPIDENSPNLVIMGLSPCERNDSTKTLDTE
jgi:hypothetical protein